MSISNELQKTIRLTVGLSCIQCCEWRSIKPAGEPGVVFGDMGIDNGGELTPILCGRDGANHAKSCNAQICPIADELAPKIADALLDGAVARIGLPAPVATIIKGISKLVALPDPADAMGGKR